MDNNTLIALVVVLAAALVIGHAGAGSAGPTDADINLLARIIDVEARGEPYRGKVAVGAVVMNRVRDPRFPDTIREVIYQPGQFYTAGLRNHPVPSADALRAAQAAVRGEDPTGGALFFYNPDIARADAWWASRPNKVRIGNHVFTH